MRELWSAIEAWTTRSRGGQYDALLATRTYVEQLTRRVAAGAARRQAADIGAEVARLAPAFQPSRVCCPPAFRASPTSAINNSTRSAAGRIPNTLAAWLAALFALRATPDLGHSRWNLAAVAQVAHQYSALPRARIDLLAEAIRLVGTTGSWQAVGASGCTPPA